MTTHVLLLNSRLAFAVSLKQALERTGSFSVHPFTTPDAAFEYLQHNPQDVALVDLSQTGMMGDELIRRLRDIQPDLSVVVSPAQADERLQRLKIHASLNMPFTARDIIPILEGAANTRPVEAPQSYDLGLEWQQDADEWGQELPLTGAFEEQTPSTPAFIPDELDDLEDVPSFDLDFGEQPDAPETLPEDSQKEPRGHKNFDDLVQSMRRQDERKPLHERTQSLIDFTLPGREEWNEEPRPPEGEDTSRLFRRLVNEEPPLPDLEENGTVGDLMSGVMDNSFRDVLAILRGEDVEEESARASGLSDAELQQVLESFYSPDDDAAPVPRPPSLPLEDSDDAFSAFDDFSRQTDDRPPTPARLILETALDETTPPEEFSLDALITNIEQKLPDYKPTIQSLPSWGTDSALMGDEPDFLPEELDDQPDYSSSGGNLWNQTTLPVRRQTTEQAPIEDTEADRVHSATSRMHQPDIPAELPEQQPDDLPEIDLDSFAEKAQSEAEDDWSDLFGDAALPETPAWGGDQDDLDALFALPGEVAEDADSWDALVKDADPQDHSAAVAAGDTLEELFGVDPAASLEDDDWDSLFSSDQAGAVEAEDELLASTDKDFVAPPAPAAEAPVFDLPGVAPSESGPRLPEMWADQWMDDWPSEVVQEQDEADAAVLAPVDQTLITGTPEAVPEPYSFEEDEWESIPEAPAAETFEADLDDTWNVPVVEVEVAAEPETLPENWQSYDSALFDTRFDQLAAFDFPDAEELRYQPSLGAPPADDPRIAQVALGLTHASLESAAVGTILTRRGRVIAYAGDLTHDDIEALRARVTNVEDTLFDFIRLERTDAEYMLYSRPTEDGLLLSMIFDSALPLRDIRRQVKRMADALDSVPEAPPDAEPEPILEPEPEPEPVLPPAPPEPVGPLTGYAALWLLRDPNARFSDVLAYALADGLQAQLQAMRWQVHEVQAVDEYIYVQADVPGDRPVPDIIRDLKGRAGAIVHAVEPSMNGGELWADGYLMMTPGRELDSDEIQQFIAFERA